MNVTMDKSTERPAPLADALAIGYSLTAPVIAET
jgi:hypothetical protein